MQEKKIRLKIPPCSKTYCNLRQNKRQNIFKQFCVLKKLAEKDCQMSFQSQDCETSIPTRGIVLQEYGILVCV
jgi:hypothetical protein